MPTERLYFAKAFPGASAKEKAFHAQLEGRDYRPEPQDVLFGDYIETWEKKFLSNCKSETKKEIMNRPSTIGWFPILATELFSKLPVLL